MLTANSLSCRRGGRVVFRDLGFTLAPGGFLHVSGRNGSGKSSLLRVLAGLLPACEGSIAWQNKPVDFATHRARLHYIGHLDGLKPELTVNETVGYWSALHGAAADKDILEPLGLSSFREKFVRHLSAGQKRKLALARLMVRKASLWLLDEPSTALDDEGQKILGEMIARHRAGGGLVIVASHHKADFRNAAHLVLDEAGQ